MKYQNQRYQGVPLLAGALLFAGVSHAQPTAPIGDPYPVVLTPTRLRQSLQYVPASVTIIRAETLRKFGVTNLPDALRLVPGMSITQVSDSGPNHRINYHGTNLLTPRRMNVLIDGVSAYKPLFARVDWKNLPISIDDIDRIEVTRGPNSVAYGPNSMLAVVNIITKHPKDVEQFFGSGTVGSDGVANVTARLGATVGATSLRATLNHEQDDGFDFDSRINGDHDSTRLDRLALRADSRLNDATLLDISVGYAQREKEVPAVDPLQTTFPDITSTDYYLSTTVVHSFSPTHELQAQAYLWRSDVEQSWTTCVPTVALLPEMFELWRANPSYVSAIVEGRLPSGGTPNDDALAASAVGAIAQLGALVTAPICLTPNQNLDERRVDLEVQDTYVVSDTLRVVGGFGAGRHGGTSQTFLGGKVTSFLWRLFGNVEFQPAPQLSLNAGAYAEHDELTGSSFSPRLAANVRISQNQTGRLVWSRGTRTPDILEERVNWSFSSNEASPPLNGTRNVRYFQSAISPGQLESEKIRSIELGYLLNLPVYGLFLDAKVFDDHLTDLISEQLALHDYSPSNAGAVHLSGAELQLNMEPSSEWSLFANYAYLDNDAALDNLERSQYSRHSGAVGVSNRLSGGWAWSLAYYGASGDGIGQSAYGRTDATVSKTFNLGTDRAEASLVLRRLDNKTQTYFRDFSSVLSNTYSNRLQLFGQLKLSF